MKKLVVLALSAVMAAGCLVGCGQKPAEVQRLRLEEAEVSEEVVSEVVEEPAVTQEALPEAEEEQTATEVNAEYKEAYLEAAGTFNETYKDSATEYCPVRFDLIDFDGDETPELVMSLNSYHVTVVTYKDGQLMTIIDSWPYGAGGNAGYTYLPSKGIVYNRNSDMAGAEVYESYLVWDDSTNEMKDMYDDYLCMRFYDDYDNDGMLTWADVEQQEALEEPNYFYGEKQITKEEYSAYQVDGAFEFLEGTVSYDELQEKLK